MASKIARNFLEAQQRDAMVLADSSDILELRPLDGPPAQHYLARFHCKGFVSAAGGGVDLANRFDVGIWLPDNYQEEFDALRVLFWFGPHNVLHPNIAPPFVCPGYAYPGMPLVELLYTLWEMITLRKSTPVECNALNKPACVWVRNNRHLFPADPRPLKRRALTFEGTPTAESKETQP